MISHLLIADCRRFRILIAITIVVIVGSALVDGVRPLVAMDRATSEALNVAATLLWLTELLLMLSVIPLVIQSDAVVGSDSFWLTRPISPRVLLATKTVLLAFLFVVAPVLTEAVLMAAHEVPPAAMLAVAMQSSLFQLLWLALLMTGAALTRSLARFALLCGGVLLALATLLSIISFVFMSRFDDAMPFASAPTTHDPTEAVVGLLTQLLVMVTCLVVLYRTRSRWRALAAGAGAIGVAFLALEAWPLAGFARLGDLPERAGAIALTLDLDSVTTTLRPFNFTRTESWGETRGQVHISGIPAGWTASLAMMAGELMLEDGRRVPSEGGGSSSQLVANQSLVSTSSPNESAIRRVTRDRLEVDRLWDSMPPSNETAVLLRLRQRTLDQFVPAVGYYRATFNVSFSEYTVEAVMPLEAGATHRHGPYRMMIDAVMFGAGQAVVVARRSNATWLWSPRRLPAHRFFLRNRARREAIAGGDYELRGEPVFSRFMPFDVGFGGQPQTGFHTAATRISFPPGYGIQGEAFDLDDAWMRDAELVIMTIAQGGGIVRSVEASGVPLRVSERSRSNVLR